MSAQEVLAALSRRAFADPFEQASSHIKEAMEELDVESDDEDDGM